jgi:hypothetical protein
LLLKLSNYRRKFLSSPHGVTVVKA